MVKVSRRPPGHADLLLQQMEAIRVSDYTKLTDPASYPTNTTVYFDEEQPSLSGRGNRLHGQL